MLQPATDGKQLCRSSAIIISDLAFVNCWNIVFGEFHTHGMEFSLLCASRCCRSLYSSCTHFSYTCNKFKALAFALRFFSSVVFSPACQLVIYVFVIWFCFFDFVGIIAVHMTVSLSRTPHIRLFFQLLRFYGQLIRFAGLLAVRRTMCALCANICTLIVRHF